jgi:hypothetical protein
LNSFAGVSPLLTNIEFKIDGRLLLTRFVESFPVGDDNGVDVDDDCAEDDDDDVAVDNDNDDDNETRLSNDEASAIDETVVVPCCVSTCRLKSTLR